MRTQIVTFNKTMKVLFLFLREMLFVASSTTYSSSCSSKCSWKVFNLDDTVATVTSSGQSSANSKVNAAFDRNNEMDSTKYGLKYNFVL